MSTKLTCGEVMLRGVFPSHMEKARVSGTGYRSDTAADPLHLTSAGGIIPRQSIFLLHRRANPTSCTI
jgi:hypothetical protein